MQPTVSTPSHRAVLDRRAEQDRTEPDEVDIAVDLEAIAALPTPPAARPRQLPDALVGMYFTG